MKNQKAGIATTEASVPTTGRHQVRALVVCVVLAAVMGFLGMHAWAMSNYLRRVSDTNFTSQPSLVPRMQVQQGFAADGQVWIQYALALANTDSLRVRHTDLDNPPAGRDVHWSSGWAWWLLGLGKLRASVTGEPLTTAVERAAVWANLPILLAGIAFLATWTGRRWGAAAVVLIAVGMAGHRDFYEAFYPGYPDHHGSIVLCLLGLLIGGLLMGAGWVKPVGSGKRCLRLPSSERIALRAANGSALFGAAGLWFSAASLVVPLAMMGIAAVIGAFWLARPLSSAGACFFPSVWRRWGRVGGGVGLGFYLLEYFPSHLGMRLEVNHPLYALAWWGGAELVAGLGAWAATGAPKSRRDVGRLVVAGLALAAVAGAFFAGGERWFVLAQPFMARLYHHVDELRPLWFNIARDGWGPHADHAGLYLVPFGLAGWLLIWRSDAVTRLFLAVILPVTLVLTALGWWQCRWLLTCGSAQILLLLVVVGCWHDRTSPRDRQVPLICVVLIAAVFYVPSSWRLWQEITLTEKIRDVRLTETLQLFYRDVAQRLAKESPREETVLLASPNASVAVGYYGGVRSVGTLYWENHEGLRKASEIWMAGSDDYAARLIRESGVTHVLLSSPHDFLAEYHDALQPGRPLEKTFGYRLLSYRLPVWLRPLNYRPPAVLAHLRLRGDLFVVDFRQTPAEAWFLQGLYLRDRGETARARDRLAASATAGFADAAVELAWMLATSNQTADRDGARALEWALLAVKARPEHARSRAVLAAAFAESGRFPEANGAVLLAMDLAEIAADPVFSARLQAQFNAYQKRRPWRE